MNPRVKAFFFHFFTLVFFVLVALAYFHPVLQGKTILQSDIQQYNGMAKEQNDFREEEGEEPYWTNSAFGGMPTYQLGARYPYHYIKDVDRAIRFLPRPADYLFLYFLGFYILLCCLRVDLRLAVLGALAFGFSTYFIIILGAGHNAKAHAIGYLPVLLGAIMLVFQRKYLWGFLLAAVAMALEVAANHFQMTYYFMLLVLVLGVVLLIDSIRNKTLGHYFKSVGLLVAAVVLGIGVNATGLLATKQYADWSTRGPSEISINPDGSPKELSTGLDRDYITQYSYGITESLNLFVPRLYGGATYENLGEDCKTYDYLVEQGLARTRALEFTSSLPLYWGKQPGTSGPAYLGAIVVFLFIMSLVLVNGPHKWWLLAGSIMALLLSWGKNFPALTDFMIDYFPLYNKFRAVSSIQVILELCIPILAVLGLARFFDGKLVNEEKLKALKIAALTTIGLGIVLLLVRGLFNMTGQLDETYERYFGEQVVSMIQRDREIVYRNDTMRSLVFILIASTVMWLYVKGRMKQLISIVVLAVLIAADLAGIAKRYVNEDQFVRQRLVREPFREQGIDKQILADTTVYRVFDTTEGLNGARTSYFYQSIGGYHAAKPAGIMNLFDFHIYRNHSSILNMLNVKYLIQEDEEGQKRAAFNPDAQGNAWFVEKIRQVNNSNEELSLLNEIQLESEALLNTEKFPDVNRFEFPKDSTAVISLRSYKPNHLIYESNSESASLAVFSEMYYEHGWNAYIDGILHPHFKVNYVLRAMELPSGRHKIEFKFEPEVIETGSKITIASSALLLLILLGGTIFTYRKSAKRETLDD